MFTVANILTGCNLLFGVTSIILSFSGRIDWAVYAILIGALCDFFDGFVARALKQQSEIGKQLDSLADIVTFGVAPGIVMFILLILGVGWDVVQEMNGNLSLFIVDDAFGFSVSNWILIYLNDLVGNNAPFIPSYFHGWNLVIPFAALLIPFFSLFRLAKFNIDKRQTTGFIGLPTPANSIFIASFALLFWSGFVNDGWKMNVALQIINPFILIPITVIFSVLLIVELPLFSLKFTHFNWKGNQTRFLFIFLSVLFLLLFWVWAIPFIVILYLLLAIIDNSSKSKIEHT